jgi:hypothetical protein
VVVQPDTRQVMNEGDPDVLEWTQIWRTNDGQGERDTFVSDSLPRFASVRSELRSCSIDHLGNEEIDLALSRHSMRSVLTACRSERYQMSDSDEVCMCRYKVNTCCAGRTTVVHQQGWPLMSDPAAESPPHPHLTLPMRELLSSSLTSNPTASSYQLYGLICHRIEMDDLDGPPPTRSQVTHYLANWRRSHPSDATEQVRQLSLRRC